MAVTCAKRVSIYKKQAVVISDRKGEFEDKLAELFPCNSLDDISDVRYNDSGDKNDNK